MSQKTLGFIDNTKLHLSLIFSADYRENRLSFFYQILAFSIVIPLLFGVIILVLFSAILGGADPDSATGFGFLLLILCYIIIVVYGIAVFIISITSSVRRLHDLGKSGLIVLWVYLAAAVLSLVGIGPLLILVFNLYLLFADTNREPHKFSHQTNPFLVGPANP
ncbi:hypothetical protein CJP74_07275 [Psittacicella melopsittaci]|uniref:DUF805 domain-containing protein n=1 Tax=Psittacicella melopsittaci TaxID=2028576 RepID=A0A3A1Y2B1_9GAMM|nr:DUF805 domain-containing protein [Psittacicella melopsittaci]RIY31436.1 hypothetical protein CJP74_07275 [Psittacicella melopsittaci]